MDDKSPTEPIDMPPENPAYLIFKHAIKDALVESRDVVKSIIVDALTEFNTRQMDDIEPDIEYHERRNVLRLIYGMLVPAGIWLITTIVFIIVSGHAIWTSISSILAAALLVFLAVVVNRVTQRLSIQASRSLKALWLGAFVVVGVILIGGLAIRGVSIPLTIIYVIVSVVLVYVIARELYLWSKFYITREGTQLKAERPGSIFFFVNDLSKVLDLPAVTEMNLTTNIIAARFNSYKFDLNSAGDQDSYWDNLDFLRDASRLQAIYAQVKRQQTRR